ncbi:hypothetical protein BAAM0483_01525 [Bifidobacterium animalis subsp. animalis MCC 0483]|uniref:Uncharacterized protein n=1 Tax=Bifidobacterium animalis subsp. animalis MCC 0483 TaxID=1365955 RepID=A0AB34TAZ0_9BIFI|nr:hypothetical protein [Bifidobacterium animalis]KOA51676.1 hypothetical protein BAAM0483_01525 [Bifidobacterium animalis subsp. animalis MCC 0483]
MANQEKKPLWKQWWFWVVIVITIAAIGGGTNNAGRSQSGKVSTAPSAPTTPTASPTTTHPKEATTNGGLDKPIESARINRADEFMKNFTGPDGGRMTDVSPFDPRDAGGQYYRTEYRLGAYDGAQGAHGKYGSLGIDVVAYQMDDGQPGMMRVYASGTSDELEALYPYVVRYFSPSASDADIQDLLARFRDGGYISETPASFAGVANNLLQRTGRNGEFMVDAKI